MTKSAYKPYWLVLLQVTGTLALVAGGIALFVWAIMVWWWFPIVVTVAVFIAIISFVVWIDQEGTK